MLLRIISRTLLRYVNTMKRALLMISALILVQGCTYHGEFIILNSSSSFLDIKYSSLNCKYYKVALTKNIDAYLKTKIDWQEDKSVKYSCDSLTNTISVRRPSNTALLLYGTHNYFKHPEYTEPGDFSDTQLLLNGVKGSVQLKGLKAIESFVNVKIE